MRARLLQLTNNNIGAVAVDEYMPLGIVTVTYPGGADVCGC